MRNLPENLLRALSAARRAVLLGLVALLSGPLPAQAQTRRPAAARPAAKAVSSGGPGYTTGLGLRAGTPAGITLKHFFKSQVAVEGIVGTSYYRRGLNLTVLIEKHGPAFQSRGLQWYYGLGGHVSSYAGRYYDDWYYDKKGRRRYYGPDYDNRRFWGLGIDGVIGLEYLFTDLPFTLGIDAKPFAELAHGDSFFGIDGAVSLRYAF